MTKNKKVADRATLIEVKLRSVLKLYVICMKFYFSFSLFFYFSAFIFFATSIKLKNKTLFHNVDRVISINDFRYPLESVSARNSKIYWAAKSKAWKRKIGRKMLSIRFSQNLRYLPSFGFRFYQRQFEKDFDRKSLFDEKVFNVISRKW